MKPKLMEASKVKQLAKRSKKEELENSFAYHWSLLYPQLPPPVRQYRFHPTRRWLFDFAWPDNDYAGTPIQIAVEIQGGTWMKKGGHTTGSGIDKDYEKWREAIRLGWRVIPFSTTDMRHPTAVVDYVAEILCSAEVVEPT